MDGGGLGAGGAGGKRRVVFAYLSQTGTAEEICGQAHAAARAAGLAAELKTADEVDLDTLRTSPGVCLVLVAASTGDGEPPQGAVKFFARAKRGAKADAALPRPEDRRLAGCRFALLGLGDSNYTSFMKVPRDTRRALLAMGAEEFMEAREADEVDGLEATVDPWLAGLLEPLKRAAGPSPAAEPPRASPSGGAERLGAEAQEHKTEAVCDPEGVPPLPPARALVALGPRPAGTAGSDPCWPSEEALAFRHPEGAYSSSEPFLARVVEAQRLSATASDREVVHLELDVEGSGLRPQPGDAFGVLPPNPPEEVSRLLARLCGGGSGLGASPCDPPPREAFISAVEPADGAAAGGGAFMAHMGWPCSVRHCLTHCLDITSPPRKTLLRFLAEHAADAVERRDMLVLCSPGGRKDYRTWLESEGPALSDVLQRFASCKPPLGALLARLPAQLPRMYSLSCAPEAHPDRLHCAFSVVRPGPGRRRAGLATAWLSDLTEGARIPVHLRSGGAFSPPEDLTKPIVLVGPGTGVAPFRGFLQRRRHALAARAAAAGAGDSVLSAGEAWLFFGCRRPEEDYLYREDLEGFEGDGTLSRLEVAFSREQAEKVYVQHRMLEHKEALRRLIFEEAGYVFVCGDGAGMAKDVHATLAEIAGDAGEASLKALTAQGRYVRDIWS